MLNVFSGAACGVSSAKGPTLDFLISLPFCIGKQVPKSWVSRCVVGQAAGEQAPAALTGGGAFLQPCCQCASARVGPALPQTPPSVAPPHMLPRLPLGGVLSPVP